MNISPVVMSSFKPKGKSMKNHNGLQQIPEAQGHSPSKQKSACPRCGPAKKAQHGDDVDLKAHLAVAGKNEAPGKGPRKKTSSSGEFLLKPVTNKGK